MASYRPKTKQNARRGKTPQYQYQKIKELLDPSFNISNVNIFGIICDVREVERSRGPDYYMVLFITDDTCFGDLKVVLFHESQNFFPSVKEGDIIRLHRLRITIDQRSKQKERSLTSNKGWSWVLFRYANPKNPVPTETASSINYTLCRTDRERVDELKKLSVPFSTDDTADYHKRISEIEPHSRCWLICKVLKFVKPYHHTVIATVWDGTPANIKFKEFSEIEHELHTDIPEDYLVDVVIEGEHSLTWANLDIMRGHFIILKGVHAFVDGNNIINQEGGLCCTLILHAGSARGRSLELAQHSARLDCIKSDMSEVRRRTMNDEVIVSDSIMESDNVASTRPTDQHTEECTSSKRYKVDTEPKTPSDVDENILTQSSDTLRSTPSPVSNEQTSAMRCLQESVSITTGDKMPLKITTLKDIIKSNVSLLKSKYFRFRGRVKQCLYQDSYAGHYSVTTGIFFPSDNSGEALDLSGEFKEFVDTWRKMRGFDQLPEATSAEHVDSQPFTQWDIPSVDGDMSSMNVRMYKCEKDGSKWDSIEKDDCVMRKRTLGDDKFKICYLLQTDARSSDRFKQYSKKFDRVICCPSLHDLTSERPPPTAYQDGVFYYICPANAVFPAMPSLKEEAENFQRGHIGKIMGSPALVPQLCLNFTLEDNGTILDDVSVKDDNAIEFLGGITPQRYLANKDGEVATVDECVKRLLEESSSFECIIEKKSRERYRHDRSQTPVYIYEITNTALKM